MPAAEIRRLGPQNLPLLRQLNAVFAEAFDERDTYLGNPPDDDWCRDLLANEDVILLVAAEDERIVGALAA